MACSSCGKKKAMGAVNNQVIQKAAVNNAPSKLFTDNFSLAKYLGEDGTVTSVLPNVSYGYRKKDSKFWVSKDDIAAKPDLFIVE